MSQTSISQYGAPGFAGMLDGIGARLVRSYAAEEAIPIGYPVKLGTNKEKQVLKTTSGALTVGFAIHDGVREQSSSGLVQYNTKDAVSVCNAGRFWVEVDDAVVVGSPANLKIANGRLTDDAVAAGIEAFTQLNVKFVTGTSAAGLALVEVK